MFKEMEPKLKSSSVVKRYENNPVVCKDDVPYPAELIFNAGVAKWKGQYVMIFRNDYDYQSGGYFKGCNLGIAFSDDGKKWTVRKEPFFTLDMLGGDPEIRRIYDPRLTVIEDQMYICFAMDVQHGIRGGVGRVRDDLSGIDIISVSAPLLAVEHVPYANDKIGPAAPPIKTEKGWLTLFHAVDRDESRGKHGWEDKWTKRYTAGIMLLDLEDPTKVIGMSKVPLIAPETKYEVEEGFRASVIFPGGMLLEDDGEVKIYYGASDTVECLATANVDELLALCTEGRDA